MRTHFRTRGSKDSLLCFFKDFFQGSSKDEEGSFVWLLLADIRTLFTSGGFVCWLISFFLYLFLYYFFGASRPQDSLLRWLHTTLEGFFMDHMY